MHTRLFRDLVSEIFPSLPPWLTVVVCHEFTVSFVLCPGASGLRSLIFYSSLIIHVFLCFFFIPRLIYYSSHLLTWSFACDPSECTQNLGIPLPPCYSFLLTHPLWVCLFPVQFLDHVHPPSMCILGPLSFHFTWEHAVQHANTRFLLSLYIVCHSHDSHRRNLGRGGLFFYSILIHMSVIVL